MHRSGLVQLSGLIPLLRSSIVFFIGRGRLLGKGGCGAETVPFFGGESISDGYKVLDEIYRAPFVRSDHPIQHIKFTSQKIDKIKIELTG
jgi:hypothetical protein